MSVGASTTATGSRAAEDGRQYDTKEVPPRLTLRSHRRLLSARTGFAVAVAAIILLALAMRLINRSTNYDVFVDELTYSSVGRAVSEGHGATLYGSPFFLHPPIFFYLEAGLLRLFGTPGSALALVLDLRLLNCVLGAVECGLVMVLVGKLSTRSAALIAGVFVAIDPFLLLWDGRVLLETLAMTAAIAGWLFLVALVDSSPRTDNSTHAKWREACLVVGGGVMFGISLLTKETYAFVGIVPLTAFCVLGRPVPRRCSGGMIGVVIICLLAYLLTIVASGELGAWWRQQSAGLQRAAGVKQLSGFNQVGHSTFASRIGADLHLYVVPYLVVVAIALTTSGWLVIWLRTARAGRRLQPKQELAIVLSTCALSYVAYAGLRGAFEEQIFYMCIVSGLPVLAVTGQSLSPRLRHAQRVALPAFAALGVAVVALELAVDVRVRTTTDSGLPELVAYVRQHVPFMALVDSTDGVSQFVLQDVRIVVATTLRTATRDRPRYVVVASGLDRQGYVKLGAGLKRWLVHDGRIVFEVRDRSIGRLLLYRVGPIQHVGRVRQ